MPICFVMTAITRPITHFNEHLRPFDVRHDLKKVAELVEQCFSDTLDEDGRRYIQQMHSAARNPGYLRWVAAAGERIPLPLTGYVWEQHGRLLGNLSLIPFHVHGRRRYLIANVAVDPGYRRRGIARALTVAAIEHAKGRRASAVWLHVREENGPAINLYRSLGFAERIRRTSWEMLEGGQEPLLNPTEQAPAGIHIASPRASDWKHQRAWLENLYPPEITWHLPFSLNSIRPDLWGTLYRLVIGRQLRQWAAYQGSQLLGVLAWQPLANHSDYLWLATAPEQEDLAIRALLPYGRRQLPSRRQVMLDYPAGRGQEAIRQAEFSMHQTLIWMEIKLGG